MKSIASLVLAASVVIVAGLRAADVGLFTVVKSQQFVQTNSGASVALSSNGFAFNALVLASTNHVVTNATVDPSNATPLRQLLSDASEATWRFEERFNTQGALDSTYPNGNIIVPVNYTMVMGTVNDGVRTVNLGFSAITILGTPPTPNIMNWPAAQSVDPAAPFTLRWTASGGFADLVQVIVSDAASNVVFASPVPFTAGALTGASNATVIPAYTLPGGTALIGHLSFVRPLDLRTNEYPGAVGVAAILKDVEFPLVTRPDPVPPRLEVASSNNHPFSLRFFGETNRNYHIQASADLIAWGDIFVTNSPTGTGSFTDPGSGLIEERFYRIQVGP